MIVTVQPGHDADAVQRALVARGLWVDRFESADVVQLAVKSGSTQADRSVLLDIEGVAGVTARRSEHPLVDRQGPLVRIGGVAVGEGCQPVFMAGPCSVESEDQIRRIAEKVKAAGAAFLRGGAFKPRSSPYAFRGAGFEALTWMRKAADESDLLVVTEAMSAEHAGAVAEVSDLVQIGSRNMHDYGLLEAVARYGRPVLLKRGMAATVAEWLMSGEYLLLHGAPAVVFCERGIRSFEPSSRNLLDLNAVALLAGVVGAPVIADPSHAAGRRDLVPALARAALAAGAHGLIVETHDDPGRARSDGPQAVSPAVLSKILAGGRR